MRTILRSEVPLYLQGTLFYESLEEGGGESFEVPANCYKTDTTLKTREDVLQLIETIRYWGVQDVPTELIAYAMSNSYYHCRPLFQGAEKDLPYLKVLSNLQLTLSPWKLNEAMRCGEVAIVQYLFENGWKWDACSMDNAAEQGHLECMKFAHQHGCALTERAFIFAAGNGHLECLKYLANNGCTDYNTAHDPYVGNICKAINDGRLHTLGACAYAAYNGHLHILQYLYANRINYWNYRTCAAAAANGRLNCLKFAHENGCPWNDTTTSLAGRHTACLVYAMRRRCPYGSQAILHLFAADHPDTGYYLRRLCTTGFGLLSTIASLWALLAMRILFAFLICTMLWLEMELLLCVMGFSMFSCPNR